MGTLGITKPEIIYRARSEEKKAKLERLYNEFNEQYSITVNEGKLIIAERIVVEDGIKICPELQNGEIERIHALKSHSHLEITLIDNNIKNSLSLFETKDNEIIQIHYKHQEF
jgi:hypothetical protein